MICDNCSHYDFDDEAQEYFCNADIDEDDLYIFYSSNSSNCPFYDPYDEYGVVRKQN